MFYLMQMTLPERNVHCGEDIEHLEGEPADAKHEDHDEKHFCDLSFVSQNDQIALVDGLARRLHAPKDLERNKDIMVIFHLWGPNNLI